MGSFRDFLLSNPGATPATVERVGPTVNAGDTSKRICALRAGMHAAVWGAARKNHTSAVSEKVVPLLAPLLSKEGLGEVLWRQPTPQPPLATGEEKQPYLSGNALPFVIQGAWLKPRPLPLRWTAGYEQHRTLVLGPS